jgi:hypothetical protein
MIKDIVATIYYILAATGVVVVVAKLLYNWFRGDQISKQFIGNMAEDHLPHIYKQIMRLQIKVGLNVTDAPPIKFMHFNKDK